MASNEYTLSHQDIVKAVIIHQGIHEGFWTLNINFNVAAAHGPQMADPCLSVTIKGIGIMRASATDPLAIDAALINPSMPPSDEQAVQITAAVTGTHDSSMQFCRDVYRNVVVQSAAKTPTQTT
ncbi:hypothetical protein WN982_36665 [Paraburkholderia sp. IMGN_8]|uniref:hypothetical protein n=1 Tax=Paraburkholderia sp. IMGN_8 TaxID=3136564 RepID=UPI0031014000